MLSNRLLYWLHHTVAVNTLMTLSIRLFAECSDDIEAAKLLFALCNALTAFSPRSASAPARYWKIPELFEFYFALTPQSLDTFQQVIALTATGVGRMVATAMIYGLYGIASQSIHCCYPA
jgi:hypothetical protein